MVPYCTTQNWFLALRNADKPPSNNDGLIERTVSP